MFGVCLGPDNYTFFFADPLVFDDVFMVQRLQDVYFFEEVIALLLPVLGLQ